MFIRDRVCETQKELLRLMGESIALGDDGLNSENGDGINEGIKTLCEIIAQNPGRRTTDLAGLLGKSVPTVERYVKALKDRGKVEFRGSKKTGGYWRVG
jgi:ATP-dependent DNA helicase RecG